MPLFEGCILSKGEGKMLITAMSITERLSNVNLNNVVKVLDCHLPKKIYRSKYMLLKDVELNTYEMYTNCCNDVFLVIFNAKNVECPKCKKKFEVKKLHQDRNIFYYLPLEPQLLEIIKSPLYNEFRKDCDEKDIVNGEVYQKLRTLNIIKDDDITIQWNTDGVSLIKNTVASTYPILVSINELSYQVRRNNIILCGLMHRSDGSIDMNIFLKPFVKEP